METPGFEIPVIPSFSIPFNPRNLKFSSDFLSKQRFQKLNLDRKMIKAFNEHLALHIDKDVLFYLKFTGWGDSLIRYQNNKVSYYRSKQLLNANVAPFEYPVDAGTLALYHLKETSGTSVKDETGNYNGTVSGTPNMDAEGRVMSPGSNFDGTDDYIAQGTLLDVVPTNGTIETWFMPTENLPLANHTYHWYKRNSGSPYEINSIRVCKSGDSTYPGNIIFVQYINDTAYIAVTTQDSWSQNTWYHLAAIWGTDTSWGSSGMKIVVNGVLDGTNADQTGKMGDGTDQDFIIGANYIPDDFIPANMDEFRVSNIQRKHFGGVSPGILL